MAAATKRWRARSTSPLTNSEPVKIGTNPSQVNAGAGSKKRSCGDATWPPGGRDPPGSAAKGRVGPGHPAGPAGFYQRGKPIVCSALALEQVGIEAEHGTGDPVRRKPGVGGLARACGHGVP